MEKKRISYAEFQASQQRKLTVAEVIHRYIDQMGQQKKGIPGIKPIGESQHASLMRIAREPFGQKIAAELKKNDIIDLARWLRQTVKPATVNAYLVYIGGALKYAGAAWDGCEGINASSIDIAKPMLRTLQIIGKSEPRTRVPKDDELPRILAACAERSKHPCTKIDLVDFTLAGIATSRRLSELCRLERGHIDWDRKDKDGTPTPMYMIRAVKHPTKKKTNDKWFPLFADFAEILKRQPVRNPDDPTEKVWPYNPHSVSQAYADVKRKLGIKDLRLHDNRRASITYWLAVFKSPHKVKQISGHATTHILERVYDATDPATLHFDYAALMKAVPQQSAAVH